MARPSDPLLAWLRDRIKDRGLNTAAVAEAIGGTRAHVRKVLAGAEPMTVDEMLLLGKKLDISPSEVGLPEGAEVEAPEPQLRAVGEDEAEAEVEWVQGVDPLGNQPEQLFRFGFALGCDFFFLARADELEGSGVPGHVLKQYEGRDLPIKLDAAYHEYNDPRYGEEGITLTLSFDALYTCTFPWTSVRQVIFFPEPPELHHDDETDEEDDEPDRPVLRLVT